MTRIYKKLKDNDEWDNLKGTVSNIIFKGKVKPEVGYGGTYTYPRKRKDKFGVLCPGFCREFPVTTKYGVLILPRKYGNKKIKVIIEE